MFDYCNLSFFFNHWSATSVAWPGRQTGASPFELPTQFPLLMNSIFKTADKEHLASAKEKPGACDTGLRAESSCYQASQAWFGRKTSFTQQATIG
ncbi:hypothetical protein AB1L42_23650 [Thalassoglobus sp. JC818]|uniref:hypothetical protein n=1 Tax=Thalassoglobus sp. JC818 TaxID=3232136 RepID=UPI00345771B1